MFSIKAFVKKTKGQISILLIFYKCFNCSDKGLTLMHFLIYNVKHLLTQNWPKNKDFFCNEAIHTNKDNCDRKSAEKMFKLVFYMILWKTELSGVGYVHSSCSE